MGDAPHPEATRLLAMRLQPRSDEASAVAIRAPAPRACGDADDPAPNFWRLLAPYALAYLLGFPFQTINGVVAPALAADFSLGAGRLGFLGASYFLAFALCQIPVGMALDRFGPRRVEALLLLVAAAGALLFAGADDFPTLLAARALIGVGVSASLMAPFKAFATRLPGHQVPLANALLFAAGGVGAALVTTPLRRALEGVGWRGVFIGLALGALVSAATVWRGAPADPARSDRPASLRELLAGALAVGRSRAYRRIAPLVVTAQGAFIAVFALWAGPWMRAVSGWGETRVAHALAAMALAMCLGYLAAGLATARALRAGRNPEAICFAGVGAFLASLVWLVALPGHAPLAAWLAFAFFGPFGVIPYATLPRVFSPALAGRVVTGLNLPLFLHAFIVQWAFGAIVSAAPEHPATAHGWALALVAVPPFVALARALRAVR